MLYQTVCEVITSLSSVNHQNLNYINTFCSKRFTLNSSMNTPYGESDFFLEVSHLEEFGFQNPGATMGCCEY